MPVWEQVIPPDDLARMERYMAGKPRDRRPGDRPALLIVDMNLRFTTDRYSSGDEAAARPVIAALKPLLVRARSASIPVIYSTTRPRRTRAQAGQWGESTVESGAADPAASAIHPELAPVEGEEVVEKNPPSAFFQTELVTLLHHYRVDTLIVTGMTTSGCVRATVVDAFSYGYPVFIPEECCGDRARLSHAVSLYDMHCKYGTVQSAAETLRYLDRIAARGATA